jgi:hypothetical protein
MKSSIILLFLAFAPVWAYAGEIVYVQSMKTNIMASPAFNAAVEAVALKGDKLEVSEKGGGWMKVIYKGKIGWVSKLVVSPNPPLEKVSVLTGTADTLEKEARRRVSTMTTAAAARGLADEDRSRLSKKGFADYESLDKIDSFKVDEKEIWNFLEGRAKE